MSDEKTEPWTEEEFDDFNVVNRWTFAETTEFHPYILDASGARKLETQGLKEFLALENELLPTFKIFHSQGTTGQVTPVRITQEEFSYWHKTVGVPKTLLKTRFNSDDMGSLEYMIERDEDGICAVSFGCDWAPYGDVYCWFICRINYRTNTHNLFVSAKKTLDEAGILAMLQDNKGPLLTEPLHLIGYLFTACGSWCRRRIQRNVRDLLEIEAEIGVTIDTDYFRSRGYKLENDDFDDINSRLFGEQKSLAIHRVYIDHLRDFSSTLQEIMQTVRAYRNGPISTDDGPWLGREDRGAYELEYLDKRMKSVINNLEYCYTISTTLFQVLYNRMLQRDAQLNYRVARAAKQDSSAMRTISILTLTFLPMTAVAAVFSGTVFNFENWGVPGQRVASEGWWVFLVTCILATVVTVGAWYAWLYKSEKKLDWEEVKARKKAEEDEEKKEKDEDKDGEEEKEEEGEEEQKDNDEETGSIKSPTIRRLTGLSLSAKSRRSTRQTMGEV